jgi:ABC-2 type transport system ATP-binding protein
MNPESPASPSVPAAGSGTERGSVAVLGEEALGEGDEVIRTVQLTKMYPGEVLAVDRLDLSVRRGEIFGLLGPNGAGKSTTAGMLTTRVIPTSGEAWVGGIDVLRQPAVAKQVIGVVPQTNTLDRSLTVEENLVFHGRFFGMSGAEARASAAALIDRIKLNRFAKAPVLALSGGMAQRLMVARAIMHRPAILFLDEPTAGLDPQSRLALYEIIRELNAEGQTVLLTTHYMDEADLLCGRVAIIDHGRVLALDTPAGLKQSLGADTIVTVTAEGDLDLLTEALHRTIPTIKDVQRLDGSLVVSVTGSDGAVASVVAAAAGAGCTVRDLKVTEPSLETVFINLTGKELRD